MGLRNFEPVLFFYEWQLISEGATDQSVVSIGSGLVMANTEERLAPHNLIFSVKQNLLDNGHDEKAVVNGRLLNIRRV